MKLSDAQIRKIEMIEDMEKNRVLGRRDFVMPVAQRRSRENLLRLKRLPIKIVILGGGYCGCTAAALLSKF